MRRLLVGPILLLLLAPPARGTSCAETLIVDGVLLWGHGELSRPLPAPAGSVEVVVPGCGDPGETGYDARTEATRLHGVPPTLAVRRGARGFIAQGTVAAVAEHPLQALAPTPRRRRCRRHRTPLRAVVRHAALERIVLVGRRGDRVVHADRATRITNRPAHQSILPGQRLIVRTSLCGRRRLADRITFAGPVVAQELVTANFGPLHVRARPWVLAALVVAGLLVAGLLPALRRVRATRG